MHSKETLKTLKLLNSEDQENNVLAQLIIQNLLTKENVIFWYIALEKYQFFNSDLTVKLTTLLGWPASSHPIEKYVDIIKFMQDNEPDAKSVFKFMEHYNEYLYSTITSNWTRDQRILIKSQIENENYRDRLSKQSNKDL